MPAWNLSRMRCPARKTSPFYAGAVAATLQVRNYPIVWTREDDRHAGHEDIELDPGADESLSLGRSIYQLIGSFKGTQRVGRKRG